MSEPRRKLIEVALPLEAINREAVRESYIYRGNPSAIHKWWTQKPLAVVRAVVLASIVDDPSSRPDRFPTEEAQDRERVRLFRLIERLARWESKDDEALIARARSEIAAATEGEPPGLLDPFSGGASIPLEGQRLGLSVYANDYNPVAALIGRALLELPRRFCDRPPVHPAVRAQIAADSAWTGVQGLAEDVRRYGEWMGEEARQRVGHLYPSDRFADGSEATVIAWLWTRTVRCPNPACRAEMPLVSSFAVSSKKGGETWVEPRFDDDRALWFEVRQGKPALQGTVNARGARCVACDEAVPLAHIRSEGSAGRLRTRLLATAVDGPGGRSYLSPTVEQERIAAAASPPSDLLDVDLPKQALGFRIQAYGMTRHRDLYTPRQLEMLGVLSDLVGEGAERAKVDSVDAEYSNAIATYLALIVDKVAQFNSALVPWYAKENRATHTFGRQTLSMAWNFAEGNVFAGVGGGIEVAVRTVADALAGAAPEGADAHISSRDAADVVVDARRDVLISTDPPYYDNVPYADLSDYFYVWLRRSLRSVHPDLFDTMLSPKAHELIAEPARFGGDREQARGSFESGVRRAFDHLREIASPSLPLTVYYAFKHAETSQDGTTVSSGWETMLAGLLDAGFSITGTWPTRTERSGRMRDAGSNALASSIVLVCRPRSESAPLATRKEFVAALKSELPDAVKSLQHGSIAPVDLAQAAIGPGMAVFSRYTKIVEADGSRMAVRTALAVINEALDELLAEQEADFDADTRWCVAWFEQYGMNEAPFGVAETLSRAKNTAINGLVSAGVAHSRAGKVRLLDRSELDEGWDPSADARLTVWEVTQHLIARHDTGGDQEAAALLRDVGGVFAEAARELAYRLYAICERKGWANEALAYNALVTAWPEVTRLAAQEAEVGGPGQQEAMEV